MPRPSLDRRCSWFGKNNSSLAGVGFVYLGAPGALMLAFVALTASFVTFNLAWRNIVYTVESIISYHQQRLVSGNTAPPQASDLSLYEGFDKRIAHLAAQLTQDATDDMAKALLLETFLKQNYRYDADSIFTSQQHTPLSSFLFETKAGHCEFFASALAVMLHSQGIPSR